MKTLLTWFHRYLWNQVSVTYLNLRAHQW